MSNNKFGIKEDSFKELKDALNNELEHVETIYVLKGAWYIQEPASETFIDQDKDGKNVLKAKRQDGVSEFSRGEILSANTEKTTTDKAVK